MDPTANDLVGLSKLSKLSASSPQHASRTTYTLPEDPLITIEASGSFVGINFDDLWSYRELLYFLIWRDIKVRYRQTVLGVAWAILQPVLTMLLFTIVFGRLAGIPSDDVPYPIFAFAGLLPWTFFANALTASTNSLVGSANLITKVYFPRMMIPAAAVGAGLIDFAIAFVVLAVLMAHYRIGVTWNLLMLPPLIVLITMLALGVGLWMSALNVKYRDARYALPFLIQLWMFASPVIYPASIVPEKWRWLLALNPLTGIIEGFRTSLFAGTKFDWPTLAISAALTLVLLVYSAYAFRRTEKVFADIV